MEILLPSRILTLLVLQCLLGSQVNRVLGDPWLDVSDQFPPLPQRVELSISLEKNEIKSLDPLIVRVTFTNQDSQPLTIETRKDGAPYSLASLVARGDGPFERHHQWLMRSSPEYRDQDLRKTLERGESTEGEFLILFGGPPTGLPFPDAGRYRVRLACQPDPHFAPAYSNEVSIIVLTDGRDNAALLHDLDELAYQRGYDRETVTRNYGAAFHIGIDLLQKVVAQNMPHLVAPEDLQGQREADLVNSLAGLLERHPNSAYSGYLARFLGLVHIRTFEHNGSKAESVAWRETGKPPQTTSETLVRDPDYQKALHYLTLADRADLWPRTTAARYLGVLHVMAQEWDKAATVVDTLRKKYAASNEAEAAATLEKEMTFYKSKIQARALSNPPP